MKQEHVNMMQELLTEERKIERLNLTRREFAEFELEIIRACEKQIAERPVGEYEECPYCDDGNIGDSDKYCSQCGKKLDWEEDNE